MLIYRLFRLNFWKQFTGSPVTDVNLSLVQILQTSKNSLRTLPNNGCCSIAYSISRLLKTVYGFSKHGCQPIACSDSATFENSLRTLPNNGCCSIAYSTSRLLKTVYRFSKHGCQSIAYLDPQVQWCSKTWIPFWYPSTHQWHTVQHSR